MLQKPALGFLRSVATAFAAPLPSLRFDATAESSENHGLPLGNGSLGAVMMPGSERDLIQFTGDSLWTGDENPSGEYQHVEKEKGSGSFGAFQSMAELSFTTTSPGEHTGFHTHPPFQIDGTATRLRYQDDVRTLQLKPGTVNPFKP